VLGIDSSRARKPSSLFVPHAEQKAGKKKGSAISRQTLSFARFEKRSGEKMA
jgi:hypothetical protein